MNTLLRELELSPQTVAALNKGGIETVDDVMSMAE
jgi:hypothetical protein